MIKTTAPMKKCLWCLESKKKNKFYTSVNPKSQLGVIDICKDCCRSVDTSDLDERNRILAAINIPPLEDIWTKSIDEVNRSNKNLNENAVLGIYLKNIKMPNSGLHEFEYRDAKKISKHNKIENIKVEKSVVVKPVDLIKPTTYSEAQERNKKDVLNLLGYDPFISQGEKYKPMLYGKLIDFLDEGTLEDSFKIPAVIEIITSYNQVDIINAQLAVAQENIEDSIKNSVDIKRLIESKSKVLKNILDLAKDNGISVNHNNEKSKGSNTLNGIVKRLNEIGLDSAEVNLFDLETCESMRQIADFSNQSILKQLMFDENDYTSMIYEQNEIIRKNDDKLMQLEEENRKLKIRIKELENK